MGVRGLWRFFDAFGEITQPGEWLGKRVAVDASIWINQFRAQCRSGENVEQRILEGFLLRILKLLFYGICPVFVFDGPATSSKLAEKRRRADQRAALERAALVRCAKQIVAAQLASGVLDVHALRQKSPQVLTAPQEQEEEGEPEQLQAQVVAVEVTNGRCNARDALQGVVPEATPVRQVRKRKRDVAADLCDISRNVTRNFLVEAAELIAERKRGEMCIKANALAYSSSSLFMGPRHVVEKPNETGVSVSTTTDTPQPVVVCDSASSTSIFVTSSDDSSFVIDDDQCSNSCNEIVSSSVSSGASVMVVDNAAETILTHLQKIDEAMSDSILDSEDDIYGVEKDSVGSESKMKCDSKSDSDQLWNPGTQLLALNGVKKGVGVLENLEVCEKEVEKNDCWKEKDEELAELSCFSGKQDVQMEAGTPLMEAGQQDAVKCVRSTEVGTQESQSSLLLPAPQSLPHSQMTMKTRQVIPQDLLGIIELLDCCRIPFVLSPSEADAQCAFLSQQRLVDAVFTEDSDVIVHGASVVLRGFFSKGRHVVAYHQRDLLACGVDKDVLVALALLLGCDYTEGVAGLSLVEALWVIAAFWRGKSGDEGPSHVRDMLTRWKNAVANGFCVRDENVDVVQFHKEWAKWRMLRVGDDFPQENVINLFFNPAVVAQSPELFADAAGTFPDWQRLRAFAGVHGLLDSFACRQRMDLAQKELIARELENNEKKNDQQLRLTDFVRQSSKQRESGVYKKQPCRIAAVLAVLRKARDVVPSTSC